MSALPDFLYCRPGDESLAEFLTDMDLLSSSLEDARISQVNREHFKNRRTECMEVQNEAEALPELIRVRPPRLFRDVSGMSGPFSTSSPLVYGNSASSWLADGSIPRHERESCRSHSSSHCLGRGSLHIALVNGSTVREVKSILADDPKATRVQDTDGMTPLHLAMKKNAPLVEAVLEVLRHDPEVAGYLDNLGRTPCKSYTCLF